MALGAAPGGIFSLVVGPRIAAQRGWHRDCSGGGFELTRAMTSMLVGVKATDPATFVSPAALFFAIAAIASWLPARRAAGLDPTAALREE